MDASWPRIQHILFNFFCQQLSNEAREDNLAVACQGGAAGGDASL